MRKGTGRHGDSLGNRETFEAPGMQWMTTGSGVEHAEGGASEANVRQQGFQIWINLPSKYKFVDPMYGTEPAEKVPLHEVGPGVTARLLAGPMGGRVGALKTYASIQMVDFDIASGSVSRGRLVVCLDSSCC
jgi:redox-sensitive bicupin YhaK (pirin superfamily)